MGRILKIAGKNMIETAENNINSYANIITNTASKQIKQTGNMFTVAGVVNKYGRNQDILRGYEFIFLSQKTLEKILKKEIIKRNKIGIEYLEIKNAECGILVQGLEVKDLYDRTIYTYYIHAIYLPENFIEG